MAANQRARGLAHLWKQVASQTTRIDPSAASASAFWLCMRGDVGGKKIPVQCRRASSNSSAYDKNLGDHGQPDVLPDDMVKPPSDKYWSPHPQTGVFGPTSEHTLSAGAGGSSSPGGGGALEEKAWFRPLEDLEKPQPPDEG